MGLQILMSAVGDATWHGDAIALRFGNLAGPRSEQVVIVIDGGREHDGENLVGFIKNEFQTRRVDAVIATHPDADHLAGLAVVLRSLSVERLLIHSPWKYNDEIEALRYGKRLDNVDIDPGVRDGLRTVRDLLDLAARKDVRVLEPFQGLAGFDRRLHILGPSRGYYQQLVRDFLRPPTRGATAAHIEMLTEDADHETLDETDTATPEDNSSVVTLLTVDNFTCLFTGDAGILALYDVADYADARSVDLRDLTVFQAPHHGSAGHISPTILDRIQPMEAFISANPGPPPTLPSAQVTNALLRRGATVWLTNDHGIVASYGEVPRRDGAGSTIAPVQMTGEVMAEVGPRQLEGSTRGQLTGPPPRQIGHSTKYLPPGRGTT